jgi:hypothetical protein
MFHFDGESLEVIGVDAINVMISEDGRRVWVCTERGTILRAKLGRVDSKITLEDLRVHAPQEA